MTKLITDEQRAQLLANGRQSLGQENFDPAPVVKLFTPDAAYFIANRGGCNGKEFHMLNEQQL